LKRSLIAPIIPPGIGLVLVGFLADVSIGRLFLAGIVPGAMMCLSLMVVVHLVSSRRGYRPGAPSGRAGASADCHCATAPGCWVCRWWSKAASATASL